MRDIHTWLFLFSKKSFLKVALLFLCIIIPLAGAQVINDINKNELLKEAEKLYAQGALEEAYNKVTSILPLMQSENSRHPLLAKIQSSLIEYADKSVASFDYEQGLAFYDKALTISPKKEIAAQKEAVLQEINAPKLIIEETLVHITENPADNEQNGNKFTYLANRSLKDKILFEQGNPLRIKFVWSEELQSLKFKLLDGSQKTVSQTNAFKLKPRQSSERKKHTSWYAFLAPYVDQNAGVYSVIIEATKADKSLAKWQGNVELVTKSFPETIIPLNARLTDLVTKPDPKKNEETKQLRDAVNAFDTEAQYHWENFVLPVEDAQITTYFGAKTIFVYNTGKKYISTHKGIDYAKPTGTPIKAMGGGKVVLSRNRIISGLSVVVEHMPGVFSMYFHLSKLHVKEGEIVTTGQVIGELGNTGLSTGAHLHLAVEIGGVPVDPQFLIENKLVFD